MKLLVAGDSFADLDPSGKDLEYCDHVIPFVWPNKLSNQVNCELAHTGVGGADIYASTYRAVSAIISDPDITHMLFFITDLNRDLINNATNKKSLLYQASMVSELMLHPFYGSHDICTYSDSSGEKSDYLLNQGPDQTKFGYFATSSPEKVLHAGLACICQLVQVCNIHNVDCVFVHTAFFEQETFIESYRDTLMPAGYKTFSYQETLNPDWGFTNDKLMRLRLEWPGHMSYEEHNELLKAFCQHYPDWLKK